MLTINVDQHIFMWQCHKPVDEMRIVVVLPQDRYDYWLQAKPEQSKGFMRQFPADMAQIFGSLFAS